MTFFLIIGFLLGVYVDQEFDNVPNVKQLFRRASNMLREAIRGETDEDEKTD